MKQYTWIKENTINLTVDIFAQKDTSGAVYDPYETHKSAQTQVVV